LSNESTLNSGPRLKRSLTLWNLIIIGIVIIQPIAPMGLYGIVNNAAGGHVVTTILIAMVAMLFTAISYGMLARVYPSAGSAYTYVGQEIHPGLGYLTATGATEDIDEGTVLGARDFLCRGFYSAQPSGGEDLGANQRGAGRRDDYRGGRIFRICYPLLARLARIWSRFFFSAVL